MAEYTRPSGDVQGNNSLIYSGEDMANLHLDYLTTEYYAENATDLSSLYGLGDVENIACMAMDADKASYIVYMYCTFSIVLIGFIGNILNILLFSSKELLTSSSDVYLLCLAVVDTVYLLVLFLSRGLTDMRCLYLREYTFDIFNRSTFACQFLQYMLDALSDFSSCIVVSFTFERVIACFRPMEFKSWCTPQRALLCCCVSFVVVFASIAPYHFLFIGRPSGFDICTILPGGEQMFSIFYICEMVVYKILPVVCIVICNFFIIKRLVKQSSRMSDIQKKSSQRSHSDHDVIERNDSYNHTNLRQIVRKCKAGSITSTTMNERTRKATIVLIGVSTCYTISVIPAIVHFVMHRLERVSTKIYFSPKVIDITLKCARILYIAGFSMNFFLYTLTGSTLRQRFIDKIYCCKQQEHPNKHRRSFRSSYKTPAVVVESCVDNDDEITARVGTGCGREFAATLDEPSTQMLTLSTNNLRDTPGSSATSLTTSV